MRTAILVTLALVGMSAQASWFQEYCSSGEGTTRIALGHNESFVQVTERDYSQDGKMTETVTRDTEGALRHVIVEERLLEQENHNSCQQSEDEFGYGSWKNVNFRKIRITKEDGSAFAKGTIGVSEDLMSVEASVICEQNGNSMISCEKRN